MRSLPVAGTLLAGALLLSGCGGPPPGVAAVVEGQRITDAEVDRTATVLCPLVAADGPSRQARATALQLLLSNALAGKVADLDDVDPAAVAGVRAQLAGSREQVPETLREDFDVLVEDIATAQAALLTAGRSSLAAGGEEVTDEAAAAEGERLRGDYAAAADIEVDPRFGTFEDGELVPGSGSLSVPVSTLAVNGQADPGTAEGAEAAQAYADLLPASQKCG